jgi:hypothetical protein
MYPGSGEDEDGAAHLNNNLGEAYIVHFYPHHFA